MIRRREADDRPVDYRQISAKSKRVGRLAEQGRPASHGEVSERIRRRPRQRQRADAVLVNVHRVRTQTQRSIHGEVGAKVHVSHAGTGIVVFQRDRVGDQRAAFATGEIECRVPRAPALNSTL